MTVYDIYLRMSLAEDELGIERQLHDCREWLAAHGGAEGKLFVDNDISATKGKTRPGFEALLQANSQAILTWHTDRLVRVSKDLERVIALNVNVHTVHAGHFDLSTPAGRAVARTVTAWATYEGEQKALRQKSSNQQRARAGIPWWSSRPFGFEMDGTHNKAEAKALKKAYAGVLEGVPLRVLAMQLNEQGLLTHHGRNWTGMTLRPVLLNARNIGVRVYNGAEVAKGNWKPVVSEDVFRAAVAILSDPARRMGPGRGKRLENLLTGFARCQVCKGPVRATLRSGGYKVYCCRKKSCVTHRLEFVDRHVQYEILSRLMREDAEEVWAQEGVDTEEAQTEASALRTRLTSMAEDYAEGLLTREQLVAATEKARTRLAEIETLLASATTSGVLAELLTAEDMKAKWEEWGLVKQRALVEMVLEDVWLKPRGRGSRAQGMEHVEVVFKNKKAPASM